MEAQVNALLAELLVLEADVKRKTKRIEEIRTWCKAQGTFSTNLYVCAVTERTRTGLAGLDRVIKAIGRTILEEHDLINTTIFHIVSVSEKPQEASL